MLLWFLYTEDNGSYNAINLAQVCSLSIGKRIAEPIDKEDLANFKFSLERHEIGKIRVSLLYVGMDHFTTIYLNDDQVRLLGRKLRGEP